MTVCHLHLDDENPIVSENYSICMARAWQEHEKSDGFSTSLLTAEVYLHEDDNIASPRMNAHAKTWKHANAFIWTWKICITARALAESGSFTCKKGQGNQNYQSAEVKEGRFNRLSASVETVGLAVHQDDLHAKFNRGSLHCPQKLHFKKPVSLPGSDQAPFK